MRPFYRPVVQDYETLLFYLLTSHPKLRELPRPADLSEVDGKKLVDILKKELVPQSLPLIPSSRPYPDYLLFRDAFPKPFPSREDLDKSFANSINSTRIGLIENDSSIMSKKKPSIHNSGIIHQAPSLPPAPSSLFPRPPPPSPLWSTSPLHLLSLSDILSTEGDRVRTAYSLFIASLGHHIGRVRVPRAKGYSKKQLGQSICSYLIPLLNSDCVVPGELYHSKEYDTDVIECVVSMVRTSFNIVSNTHREVCNEMKYVCGEQVLTDIPMLCQAKLLKNFINSLLGDEEEDKGTPVASGESKVDDPSSTMTDPSVSSPNSEAPSTCSTPTSSLGSDLNLHPPTPLSFPSALSLIHRILSVSTAFVCNRLTNGSRGVTRRKEYIELKTKLASSLFNLSVVLGRVKDPVSGTLFPSHSKRGCYVECLALVTRIEEAVSMMESDGVWNSVKERQEEAKRQEDDEEQFSRTYTFTDTEQRYGGESSHTHMSTGAGGIGTRLGSSGSSISRSGGFIMRKEALEDPLDVDIPQDVTVSSMPPATTTGDPSGVHTMVDSSGANSSVCQRSKKNKSNAKKSRKRRKLNQLGSIRRDFIGKIIHSSSRSSCTPCPLSLSLAFTIVRNFSLERNCLDIVSYVSVLSPFISSVFSVTPALLLSYICERVSGRCVQGVIDHVKRREKLKKKQAREKLKEENGYGGEPSSVDLSLAGTSTKELFALSNALSLCSELLTTILLFCLGVPVENMHSAGVKRIVTTLSHGRGSLIPPLSTSHGMGSSSLKSEHSPFLGGDRRLSLKRYTSPTAAEDEPLMLNHCWVSGYSQWRLFHSSVQLNEVCKICSNIVKNCEYLLHRTSVIMGAVRDSTRLDSLKLASPISSSPSGVSSGTVGTDEEVPLPSDEAIAFDIISQGVLQTVMCCRLCDVCGMSVTSLEKKQKEEETRDAGGGSKRETTGSTGEIEEQNEDISPHIHSYTPIELNDLLGQHLFVAAERERARISRMKHLREAREKKEAALSESSPYQPEEEQKDEEQQGWWDKRRPRKQVDKLDREVARHVVEHELGSKYNVSASKTPKPLSMSDMDSQRDSKALSSSLISFSLAGAEVADCASGPLSVLWGQEQNVLKKIVIQSIEYEGLCIVHDLMHYIELLENDKTKGGRDDLQKRKPDFLAKASFDVSDLTHMTLFDDESDADGGQSDMPDTGNVCMSSDKLLLENPPVPAKVIKTLGNQCSTSTLFILDIIAPLISHAGEFDKALKHHCCSFITRTAISVAESIMDSSQLAVKLGVMLSMLSAVQKGVKEMRKMAVVPTFTALAPGKPDPAVLAVMAIQRYCSLKEGELSQVAIRCLRQSTLPSQRRVTLSTEFECNSVDLTQKVSLPSSTIASPSSSGLSPPPNKDIVTVANYLGIIYDSSLFAVVMFIRNIVETLYADKSIELEGESVHVRVASMVATMFRVYCQQQSKFLEDDLNFSLEKEDPVSSLVPLLGPMFTHHTDPPTSQYTPLTPYPEDDDVTMMHRKSTKFFGVFSSPPTHPRSYRGTDDRSFPTASSGFKSAYSSSLAPASSILYSTDPHILTLKRHLSLVLKKIECCMIRINSFQAVILFCSIMSKELSQGRAHSTQSSIKMLFESIKTQAEAKLDAWRRVLMWRFVFIGLRPLWRQLYLPSVSEHRADIIYEGVVCVVNMIGKYIGCRGVRIGNGDETVRPHVSQLQDKVNHTLTCLSNALCAVVESVLLDSGPRTRAISLGETADIKRDIGKLAGAVVGESRRSSKKDGRVSQTDLDSTKQAVVVVGLSPLLVKRLFTPALGCISLHLKTSAELACIAASCDFQKYKKNFDSVGDHLFLMNKVALAAAKNCDVPQYAGNLKINAKALRVLNFRRYSESITREYMHTLKKTVKKM